jgi:type II secretory pathway component GspD/PulD (secretin)
VKPAKSPYALDRVWLAVARRATVWTAILAIGCGLAPWALFAADAPQPAAPAPLEGATAASPGESPPAVNSPDNVADKPVVKQESPTATVASTPGTAPADQEPAEPAEPAPAPAAPAATTSQVSPSEKPPADGQTPAPLAAPEAKEPLPAVTPPVAAPAVPTAPESAAAAQPAAEERPADQAPPTEPATKAETPPTAPAPPAPAAPESTAAKQPAAEVRPADRAPATETATKAETPAGKDAASAPKGRAGGIDLPPDVAAAIDRMAGAPTAQGLRFAFRYQPWQDVLQWFADQAGLSMIMDNPPPGTFNYTDERTFTPAQAIDLLNGVLLTKGYTLVRRDRMLMVINLEDKIPPNLVSTIPQEELDDRGEFELVNVVFQLDKFDPTKAEAEIKRLIGPQGNVVVLPTTRQISVTETAGKLRTIRQIIQRVEDPAGLLSGKLEIYEFKNLVPDEALPVIRQLLDIPADGYASSDGTLRIAADPMGMRLFYSGSSEKVAKVKQILTSIDVPPGGAAGEAGAVETLQLEVYPITVADPQSVLQVMQTLLTGLPGVRLSIDAKTNSLIALAKPSDHKTIRATIDQMQAEVRRIEVITLQTVDPQLAVLSIKRLFGEPSDQNKTAPAVEADSLTRQLIVHGTEAQIEQIRVLLGKMGEASFAGGDAPIAANRIRVLPITGQAAESALQNLRMIWPAIRENEIKELNSQLGTSLGPSGMIPARVPGGQSRPAAPRSGPMPPRGLPGIERAPAGEPEAAPPKSQPGEDRQTAAPGRTRFLFAAQTSEEAASAGTQAPAPVDKKVETPAAPNAAGPVAQKGEKPALPKAAGASPSDQPAPLPAEVQRGAKSSSPLVISRGPDGLLIASDDIEALDEAERLLTAMAGGTDPRRTELTIFYLKHAKAAEVAEQLTAVIGSGTSSASTTTSTTAGSKSLLGSLPASPIGGGIGALLGAATLSPTGMLRITAVPRLNALLIEANATDLRTIEEVLKLLDQPAGPEEVLVESKPRMIPVNSMPASEAAEIVKQVFADKMRQASSRGGQMPTPEDIMNAMRGGGREGGSRGGTSRSSQQQQTETMTIGVDERSNSLIVYASTTLYEQVRMLVEELDTVAGAAAADEATEVITLERISPTAMKSALTAIMGQNAVVTSSSSSSSRGASSTSRSGQTTRSGSQPATGGGMSDEMRRRIEFFRSMQGQGGGPGMFGRPGGFGGGAQGGFGGRGGGGGR